MTQLRDGLYARLKPVGEVEELYVERIIAAAWRLRRTFAAEGEIARRWNHLIRTEAADLVANPTPAADLERVQKQTTALERSMDKAVNELKKLQARRAEEAEEAEESDAETAAEESSNADTSAKLRIEILKTNPISVPRKEPNEQGGKEESPNRQNEPNFESAASPGDAGGGAIPASTPDVT